MRKWTEHPFVGLIAGQICIFLVVIGVPVSILMVFLGYLSWAAGFTLALFFAYLASLTGQISQSDSWKPSGGNAVFFSTLPFVSWWLAANLIGHGEWYFAAITCLMVYFATHVCVVLLSDCLRRRQKDDSTVTMKTVPVNEDAVNTSHCAEDLIAM